MSLFLSLCGMAAVLCAVTFAGSILTPAMVPSGRAWAGERWAWRFTLGAALVSVETAGALALGLSPGWIPFLISAAISTGAWIGRLGSVGSGAPPEASRPRDLRWLPWLLRLILVCGVALYFLRALTEPMWSNDYLAIWGLKAKTIYFARAFPGRGWPQGFYGFAHPEYPLGLPMLLAGLSFLVRRWDDHALALLFPIIQVATLAGLFGWLRRRRTPWTVSLAAVALLSQFEPLYSGFLTGMAEVPLSCVLLLFGTALTDCLDEGPLLDKASSAASGANRRLFAASLLAAATKNEGIFFAFAAAVIALLARRPGRFRSASCALLPAVVVAAGTGLVSSHARLRDFDWSFIGPRISELPGRIGEALRAALVEVVLPAWPGLLCLAVLILVGRRTRFADRLLWLASACLMAYLLLPALAVPGPAWLVRTTLPRTAAALAPLLTAGVAGRFAGRGAAQIGAEIPSDS